MKISSAFDAAYFAQLQHGWLRKTENHLNRVETELYFKVGIQNDVEPKAKLRHR